MSKPSAVRETLARNTTYNAVGRIWEAVSTIILMRYIVERVGLPAYGMWALLGSFNGYVSLLDFGIGSSFVKYIAEHAARREDDKLSSVVATGFAFYLAFGTAIVLLGWPCIDELIALGSHGQFLLPDTIEDARFLLRWSLVLFAASNCVAAFTAIQTGLQRMGLTNTFSIGASLIKIAATVGFLEAGHGVRGLLYANALSFLAFSAASVWTAFALVPNLRLSARYVTRPTFAKLFHFGWRAQVSKLSDLIMFRTDHVVMFVLFSRFNLVGLYDLGVRLAGMLRQAPIPLLSTLLPAASDLDARNEQERLQRLYLVSTKYVALLTVPMTAFVVGAAGPLMRTWMGPGYDTSAWVLRIMAFGYIANILPGVGVSIALGKGRPDVQMKAGLISMFSNIALTIVLVYTIGFWGIPLGTMFSMFLSWAWFAWAMHGIVGVGPKRLLGESMLWPGLAAAPGLLLCGVLDVVSANAVGFFANAGVLCVSAALFAASYLVLLRWTPCLSAYDLEFFDSTLHLRRVPGYSAWTRRMRRV